MLGKKRRPGRELFYIAGSIEDLIPEDYVLKKVNKVLDLGWLREEVRGLYCENNGRPGIDPECAVRLMLAGFMLGISGSRAARLSRQRPLFSTVAHLSRRSFLLVLSASVVCSQSAVIFFVCLAQQMEPFTETIFPIATPPGLVAASLRN